MKYKIEIPDNYSLEYVKNEIDKGGKFIIYSYCISLFFAVTLKRISKAYFIPSNEKNTKYKKKYNLINLVFGWWGIPWGLIYTINYIKLNNRGGTDITKDILINLDDKSITNKEVELIKIYTIFIEPTKSEIYSMKKVILKRLSKKIVLENLYLGYYINTENNQKPFFTVGVKSKNDFTDCVYELKIAIYKEFYKHTHFEIINLYEPNKMNEKLIEQGIKLL